MKRINKLPALLLLVLLTGFVLPAHAVGDVPAEADKKGSVDVKEIIFGHIGDAYEWHITTIDKTPLSIPLPIIVYSKQTGWHAFLSSRLQANGSYEGLSIAPAGSRYEGKVVEHDAAGNEVRPWDISITKVTFALLINSLLVVALILGVARWYRRHPQGSAAPGGFIGFMEMFIMMIYDDVIKSCVGENYRKFAPYLLTVFFFIFTGNLMGLIPFFPGGANVTGNIAVTMVLAVCTFLTVNLFGTKTYWKEIFWPDVPWWLKVPIPMMPFIEFFGVFTKPFALMIRLFANMLSGHMSMLVLTSLIFLTAGMGAALNGTMTVISVLFNIFMNLLEVLIAFIQAYVFTMLSAVFIGLAQEKSAGKEKVSIKNQ
ncbi:MAG: F0F1 ATP synthase subunit A [Prevotellaceae bacterium]|nr:F0F1 ATP synthase subunit A [Prevotellaceae bacterium]